MTPTTTFGWDHLESFEVEVSHWPGFPFEASVFSLLQRCAYLKSAKIALIRASDWQLNGVTYTLPFLSKLVLSSVIDRNTVNELGDFLMAVPNLKSFDYTYHINPPEVVYSPEALIRLLPYATSTLEHLRIDLKCYRYHRFNRSQWEDDIVRGKLVGLQDFSSLVSLEIWATMLLGCPDFSSGTPNLGALLPRNLKKLHLAEQLSEIDQMRWFDKDYAELLRVFLSSWHEYTPDLEVLILEITAGNEKVEEQQVWKLLNDHSLEWEWRQTPPGYVYTVNLRREKI